MITSEFGEGPNAHAKKQKIKKMEWGRRQGVYSGSVWGNEQVNAWGVRETC